MAIYHDQEKSSTPTTGYPRCKHFRGTRPLKYLFSCQPVRPLMVRLSDIADGSTTGGCGRKPEIMAPSAAKGKIRAWRNRSVLRGCPKRFQLNDMACFFRRDGVYPRPWAAHAACVSAGHKALPYIFQSTLLGATERFWTPSYRTVFSAKESRGILVE